MPEEIRKRRKAPLEEEREESAPLSDAMIELERKIASTPARSMADVRLKLWVHGYVLGINYEEVLSDAAYTPSGGLMLSALRDVERLAGASA